MRSLLDALERRRTSRKLALGPSVLLAVTLVIGGYGLSNLNGLNRRLQDVYHVDTVALARVQEAEVYLVQMGRSLRHMALAVDPAQADRARPLSLCETPRRPAPPRHQNHPSPSSTGG